MANLVFKNSTDILINFIEERWDEIEQKFSDHDEKINFNDFEYYLKELLGINLDCNSDNVNNLQPIIQFFVFEGFYSADLKKVYKTFLNLRKQLDK